MYPETPAPLRGVPYRVSCPATISSIRFRTYDRNLSGHFSKLCFPSHAVLVGIWETPGYPGPSFCPQNILWSKRRDARPLLTIGRVRLSVGTGSLPKHTGKPSRTLVSHFLGCPHPSSLCLLSVKQQFLDLLHTILTGTIQFP